MPSESYGQQRFASRNPAHPSTWVRVCVLYAEPLWRSRFLRLSEEVFGLPAASRVQQQRRRTPTPAQGRLWSESQIKPCSLLQSFAPLPNYRRLLKTLPQTVGCLDLSEHRWSGGPIDRRLFDQSADECVDHVLDEAVVNGLPDKQLPEVQRSDKQLQGQLRVGSGSYFMPIDGTVDDDTRSVVAGLPALSAI